MDSNLHDAVTRLERGAILRLHNALGCSVVVFRGLVWITQDGDPRDVFVAAGHSFQLDRPGLALVQGIEQSSLVVLQPAAARAEPAGTHSLPAIGRRGDPRAPAQAGALFRSSAVLATRSSR